MSPVLGDFYRVINFVNNWSGSAFTAKTAGTITWTAGGSGGEFFYEQSNTMTQGGVGGAPDFANSMQVLSADGTFTATQNGYIQKHATITHPNTAFAWFKIEINTFTA